MPRPAVDRRGDGGLGPALSASLCPRRRSCYDAPAGSMWDAAPTYTAGGGHGSGYGSGEGGVMAPAACPATRFEASRRASGTPVAPFSAAIRRLVLMATGSGHGQERLLLLRPLVLLAHR